MVLYFVHVHATIGVQKQKVQTVPWPYKEYIAHEYMRPKPVELGNDS